MMATAAKLRPKKIRLGLRRRRFEYQLERTPFAAIDGLEDLGTAYGGWLVPTPPIGAHWICYSVGAGGDISFDLELIARFGLTVRSFDAVADYVEQARATAAGEPRFTAQQAAVAMSDGPLRMQVTHDPRSMSVSSAGLYESERFIEVPGRTLRSLMDEHGDERIDLLKLDVEGAEYELLPRLGLRDLGVRVFAVQLHHSGTVADARRLIRGLAEEGYEPVGCRPAVKITFAARDLLKPPAPLSG